MFLRILEVILSLFLIYWLLSIFVEAIVELISRIKRKRSSLLVEGITGMLGADGAQEFFRDGLIASLWMARPVPRPAESQARTDNKSSRQGVVGSPPVKAQTSGAPKESGGASGIPAHYFALVVLRMLKEKGGDSVLGRELRRRLGSLNLACCVANSPGAGSGPGGSPKPGDGSASQEQSCRDGEGPAKDSDVTILEKWFDRVMERLSGKYRRWAGAWAVVISGVICAGLNLDTIAVVRGLAQADSRTSKSLDRSLLEHDTAYSDSLNRRAISAQADTSRAHQQMRIPLGRDTAVSRSETLAMRGGARLSRRDSLVSWRKKSTHETESSRESRFELVAGWHGAKFRSPFDIIARLLGILISVAAGSMGAGFWYSLLKTHLKGAGEITPVIPGEPSVRSKLRDGEPERKRKSEKTVRLIVN